MITKQLEDIIDEFEICRNTDKEEVLIYVLNGRTGEKKEYTKVGYLKWALNMCFEFNNFYFHKYDDVNGKEFSEKRVSEFLDLILPLENNFKFSYCRKDHDLRYNYKKIMQDSKLKALYYTNYYIFHNKRGTSSIGLFKLFKEMWQFIIEEGDYPNSSEQYNDEINLMCSIKDAQINDRKDCESYDKNYYKEQFPKKKLTVEKEKQEADNETDKTIKAIESWLSSTSFKEFYNAIRAEVIGQESLKEVVANVYLYLKNIVVQAPINQNMLLTAPSGCGKTETYRALKAYFKDKIPDLAFALVDSTELTETGYKGKDASSILMPFAKEKNSNPIGLIFLDEFDKKMLPSIGSGQNVNKAVQSALLTMIEGAPIGIELNNGKEIFTVNTDRLMFVGMGAFSDFREDRNEKEDAEDPFSEPKETYYKALDRDDMMEVGASSELLGRFPYIVNYNHLSGEALDSVIQKCIKKAQRESNLKKLEVKEPMMSKLKASANSKYGCRLITSTLKTVILKAYSKELFNSDSMTSLTIYDEDKFQFS